MGDLALNNVDRVAHPAAASFFLQIHRDDLAGLRLRDLPRLRQLIVASRASMVSGVPALAEAAIAIKTDVVKAIPVIFLMQNSWLAIVHYRMSKITGSAERRLRQVADSHF